MVVGRSPEKTAAVAAELDGAPALTADFARLDDVRRLAGELRTAFPRIDVLVDNAGASFGQRALTVDGNERTFQVDHLAAYLLTRLLEEPLRAAPVQPAGRRRTDAVAGTGDDDDRAVVGRAQLFGSTRTSGILRSVLAW